MTSSDNALTRAEINEFWEGWLQANRDVEKTGDWRPLAEWYAEDASYGWMYSPDEHFMAVGRDQIRDWAIGIEMDGLDGWKYDYQVAVVDDEKQMVVGFWKQRSGITNDETNKEFEILGIGGSWVGVERQASGADAGQIKIAWQRDWFDMGSVTSTFIDILKAGKAPDTLLKRMEVSGHGVPGHYHYEEMPSPVWPPSVERGDYLANPADGDVK